MAKFQTTRFGELEFSEETIIQFPEGLLGFPRQKLYILLEHDTGGTPFKWLQSLEDGDLAFIVIDPLLIDTWYQFEIDTDTARLIEAHRAADCAVMAIVNVPLDKPSNMTANLKAPLVVNVENHLGRQMILASSAYGIQIPIFSSVTANLVTAPEALIASREL
jgi:flagellar assembly factor FliW